MLMSSLRYWLSPRLAVSAGKTEMFVVAPVDARNCIEDRPDCGDKGDFLCRCHLAPPIGHVLCHQCCLPYYLSIEVQERWNALDLLSIQTNS